MNNNTPSSNPSLSQEQFNISPSSLSELHHLTTLLHLFHTRNKNQHSHSIWYRHFNIFRRQLSHLTSNLTTLNTIPTTSHHAQTHKKKTVDPILIARIRARENYWRDFLARKWQRAFSQLVADQRFGVLGIFLLAVLAHVCGIVGITAEWEEMGEVEVRKAIEAFGREMRGDDGGDDDEEEDEVRGLLGRGENEAAEDAGQVVSREGEGEVAVALVADGIRGGDERLDVLPARSVGDTRKRKSEGAVDVKKKKKKRKRVGGDAIDDIFG
ncbi:hypothetical protein SMMN14_05918 [Sphaerulina musiva]